MKQKPTQRTELDGGSVETWYDRRTRSWVTQSKDAKGNQKGDAFYSGTAEAAIAAHAAYMKEWLNWQDVNFIWQKACSTTRLVKGVWLIQYAIIPFVLPDGSTGSFWLSLRKPPVRTTKDARQAIARRCNNGTFKIQAYQ